MSYTELHYGKLKPIRTDFSIDALKELIIGNNHLEIEDFDERLENNETYFEVRDKNKKYKEPLYLKYIFKDGVLYEMTEHSGELETDNLDITRKDENGDVFFAYMFYNGGTCFSEMLEDGLKSIK